MKRKGKQEFYLFRGNICAVFLRSSVDVGIMKVNFSRKTILSDLQLVPNSEWKKATLIPKRLLKRLVIEMDGRVNWEAL